MTTSTVSNLIAAVESGDGILVTFAEEDWVLAHRFANRLYRAEMERRRTICEAVRFPVWLAAPIILLAAATGMMAGGPFGAVMFAGLGAGACLWAHRYSAFRETVDVDALALRTGRALSRIVDADAIEAVAASVGRVGLDTWAETLDPEVA